MKNRPLFLIGVLAAALLGLVMIAKIPGAAAATTDRSRLLYRSLANGNWVDGVRHCVAGSATDRQTDGAAWQPESFFAVRINKYAPEEWFGFDEPDEDRAAQMVNDAAARARAAPHR